MLGLIIYVCISAAGLTLIKIGTGKSSSLLINSTGFELRINWVLLIGLVVYVLSFLLSIMVMKRMNLSFFYPVSAGCVYVLICLLSYFVLHEHVGLKQLTGMVVIFAGILIMNLGKV